MNNNNIVIVAIAAAGTEAEVAASTNNAVIEDQTPLPCFSTYCILFEFRFSSRVFKLERWF